MEKDYLNISKASDIKDKKEKILYRSLEILPGFLSLSTLFLAIIFSHFLPQVVAVFIILFCFFYLIKVIYFGILQIISWRKMIANLKADVFPKLKKDKRFWQIYQLIILPTFQEPEKIIKDSLDSLLKSNYPKEKMIVVLATEERAGKKFLNVAEKIKRDYENKFFRFLVTLHPKNIPGEIAGKGSNVNWAIKKAYEEIIKPLKIKPDNVIVSNFDIDTKVYPNYFLFLTLNYLKNQSKKLSFQPIPLYHNNLFSAPAISRVVATSNSFWQMIMQERQEALVTYSSHSLSLKVALSVGYPNNVVSDDSRIFWKSYFYYDGNYKVLPLYYPVSMDNVFSGNFWRTVLNLFKQQKRWAWGCNEIPYIIFGFLKNKKIPLKAKLFHTINILEGFWSWAVAAILIFCLGWLPILIGGENFNQTILAYNLPRITSQIMTIALIGLFISSILNLSLLPPLPKNYSKLKLLPFLFQWVFLPFTLFFFGSIPALSAQIDLMRGKYLGFWVTEKYRK